MPITDTGTATCDCGEHIPYLDVHGAHRDFLLFTDKHGLEVKACPGCGHNLHMVALRIKSNKPAFSPLAGYEPPVLSKHKKV